MGRNKQPSELEVLLASKEPATVLEAILGSTPSGAIIASVPNCRILRFSDYAAGLFGWSRSDVEGRSLRDVLGRMPLYDASGRLLPEAECPLFKAMQGETVIGFELQVRSSVGELIPCISNAAPIRNSSGALIGAITSFADLRPCKALERDLRASAAQHETLYRELTHRVKNHLQILSGLVSLAGRNPTLTAKSLADQTNAQLQALAAVYRGMDRAEVGARVEARSFVEDVCQSYASEAVSVEAAVSPPDLTLDSEQAGPVGMLVNEAVCNSHKHAFPNGRGHIYVSLRRVELGRLHLEVSDDGVGWGAVDPSRHAHGLDLMRLFAKQLHGELELGVDRRGGAMVAADIPETIDQAPARIAAL